jgi:hypothetical protein
MLEEASGGSGRVHRLQFLSVSTFAIPTQTHNVPLHQKHTRTHNKQTGLMTSTFPLPDMSNDTTFKGVGASPFVIDNAFSEPRQKRKKPTTSTSTADEDENDFRSFLDQETYYIVTTSDGGGEAKLHRNGRELTSYLAPVCCTATPRGVVVVDGRGDVWYNDSKIASGLHAKCVAVADAANDAGGDDGGSWYILTIDGAVWRDGALIDNGGAGGYVGSALVVLICWFVSGCASLTTNVSLTPFHLLFALAYMCYRNTRARAVSSPTRAAGTA